MSLIDDIKRDREAGTPGPWRRGQDGNLRVYGPDGSGRHSGLLYDLETGHVLKGAANARRIARVPDLEAALLAADELANALDAYKVAESAAADTASEDDYAFVFECWDRVETAIAAYRKATEGAQ